MKKIKILITEDHALVRTIWSKYLSTDPEFDIVAEAASAEECLKLGAIYQPDIVLLDINLPGINGIEAIQPLKNCIPGVKIIGVSAHTHPSFVKTMMRNGASGYLTKNASAEELIESIKAVHSGLKYSCLETKNILSNQFFFETDKPASRDINSLTTRELQIIEYIKQGYASPQIGEALNITKKTVEVHRYNILSKLNLRNAASLVNFINQNYYAIANHNGQLNISVKSRAAGK